MPATSRPENEWRSDLTSSRNWGQILTPLFFWGKCGPRSRRLARLVADRLPERYGGDLLSYMILGRPSAAIKQLEVETEIDGAQFVFDLTDGLDRHCFLGTYESAMRAEVNDLLGNGGMLVDIGANLGIYSVPRAVKGSRVVAIEALPSTAARLSRNWEQNSSRRSGDLRLVNAAASASNGTLTLHAGDLSRQGGTASARATTGADAIEVPALPLDEILSEEQVIHPAAWKIDVEGHEMQVLEGARDSLGRLKPDWVAVEIVDEFLRQAGASGNAIVELMREAGYQPSHAYPLFPWIRKKRVPNVIGSRYAATVIFVPTSRTGL